MKLHWQTFNHKTRKAVKARRYLSQGYWFDTACPPKTNKRKFWVRFKL